MKVEVDFPADFTSNEVCPIHIGRLQLGKWIARLYFKTDGTVAMAVDKRAIEDDSIVLTDTCSDSHITLAGPKP